jgi:hypothetical protein
MGENIKTDLEEMEGCGLTWSGSRQGEVVGPRGNGNEPSGSLKCGEFVD